MADEKSETVRELVRLARGDREELRLTLDRFKGHEYVSARVWYQPAPGALWLPSKKGLTFKLRELPDVVRALTMVAGMPGASE
jgi:hypothetical protein